MCIHINYYPESYTTTTRKKMSSRLRGFMNDEIVNLFQEMNTFTSTGEIYKIDTRRLLVARFEFGQIYGDFLPKDTLFELIHIDNNNTLFSVALDEWYKEDPTSEGNKLIRTQDGNYYAISKLNELEDFATFLHNVNTREEKHMVNCLFDERVELPLQIKDYIVSCL